MLTEIEVIYAHEIMPDSQIHSAYRMEERGENEVVVWHEVKDETERLTHCQAKTVSCRVVELLSYRVAEL